MKGKEKYEKQRREAESRIRGKRCKVKEVVAGVKSSGEE